MEGFKSFPISLLATMLVTSLVVSVNGQIISTACTNSMIGSFTPCLNYITGSSSNGSSSPSAGCCGSVKSLLSTAMDCACLIVTGNIPFSLPINRTLAISLPRACKTGGVPVQCKAAGVPIPAPGPAVFGGSTGPSPSPSATLSPGASKAATMAPRPSTAETTSQAPVPPPPPPPLSSAKPGIRPVVTPTSASIPSPSIPSLYILLTFVGMVMVFKGY